MTPGALVLVLLAAGTYGLKAAGPLLLGGRELPAGLRRLARLLPAALLAALVAVNTAVEGGVVVIDARLAGLAAAAVGLRLGASFAVVVVLAALATAATRLVVA